MLRRLGHSSKTEISPRCHRLFSTSPRLFDGEIERLPTGRLYAPLPAVAEPQSKKALAECSDLWHKVLPFAFCMGIFTWRKDRPGSTGELSPVSKSGFGKSHCGRHAALQYGPWPLLRVSGGNLVPCS